MSLRVLWKIGMVVMLLAAAAAGQAPAPPFLDMGGSACCPDDSTPRRANAPAPLPVLDVPVVRPQMSSELALHTYLQMAGRQLTELGFYSDQTLVEADLPDTKQHGRYELRRSFLAPKSLAYGAVRFIGDGFVKTNVITRLLQSEVDHVEKGHGADIAINETNYKFSFKSIEPLGDRAVYAYHVKPRRKVPGLFKGKIYLDPVTGRLLRAEGSMVKSPSFFIKKLDFLQDYATVGTFSLPVHIHTVAKTRIVGRAVVDIFHTGYEAKSLSEVQSETPVPAASSGNHGDN